MAAICVAMPNLTVEGFLHGSNETSLAVSQGSSMIVTGIRHSYAVLRFRMFTPLGKSLVYFVISIARI
jgi:hypothetical protein